MKQVRVGLFRTYFARHSSFLIKSATDVGLVSALHFSVFKFSCFELFWDSQELNFLLVCATHLIVFVFCSLFFYYADIIYMRSKCIKLKLNSINEF